MSFLWLKGRCRHCSQSISRHYPLIEIAAVVVAGWVVITVPEHIAIPTVVLGWSLLCLAVIDIRTMRLPDSLTLPLVVLGLVVTAILSPPLIVPHLVAALAGFASFWFIGLVYEKVRGRTGLGLGDAKLFAAAGAWVGPEGLLSVLLVGAFLALAGAVLVAVIKKAPLSGATAIPFGPFLAAGFWVAWLYGPLKFIL